MEKGTVNNGGHAFPIATAEDVWQEGMTIRSYFAAKALCGMISRFPENRKLDYKDIASDSVMLADALIEALNK